MNDGIEPNGGNLYRPHVFMIDSGTFWRCAHGRTGISSSGVAPVCWECAAEEPKKAIKWHGKKQFGKALRELLAKTENSK